MQTLLPSLTSRVGTHAALSSLQAPGLDAEVGWDAVFGLESPIFSEFSGVCDV